MAVVAMGGRIDLIRIGAAALGDDVLPFAEEMVADFDRLAEQSAGIATQVENQALQVAETIDGLNHLAGCGLLELGEVDVANAGANFVFEVDRGVGNFVTYQVKGKRLALSLANHGDLNMCALDRKSTRL